MTTPSLCYFIIPILNLLTESVIIHNNVQILLWEDIEVNQFSRAELLLGEEAMEKLSKARVAIFGIGGVGGYVVEALVRCGITRFDLIDDDKVCLTNINRQIIATRKTIGQYKVEVMRDRILEINPKADVVMHRCFFTKDAADQFDFAAYDYVVDAIDTVSGKIELVLRCEEKNVPIISCMGTISWTQQDWRLRIYIKHRFAPLPRSCEGSCQPEELKS